MNGFEQLCINLSNEELQHHFNEDIFLNEASDYEKDGLKGLSITYQDNADVLALIAGKGGKDAAPAKEPRAAPTRDDPLRSHGG